jgi:site-specific recombinase XerD
MKWPYWITLFTGTHCTARGLRPSTIAAYRATLYQFRAYTEVVLEIPSPDAVTAKDVLEYVEHLRRDRHNGGSAVHRQVTIIRGFYQAMVAMGHLEPRSNPMLWFPRVKSAPRKLPVILSAEEVHRLLAAPNRDTIIGLRDRAILALLYGTGIRASECATLKEGDVDLDELTIMVTGKGGHHRTIPLNVLVAKTLQVYRHARGLVLPGTAFFQSRSKKAMSRGAIYERVRKYAQQGGVHKPVSPHRIRHTFATHLVKVGVDLVTIRDLLGHRQLSSTQVYLHVTAHDLREAADRHPIGRLADTVAELLPEVKLPFQYPPGRQRYG